MTLQTQPVILQAEARKQNFPKNKFERPLPGVFRSAKSQKSNKVDLEMATIFYVVKQYFSMPCLFFVPITLGFRFSAASFAIKGRHKLQKGRFSTQNNKKEKKILFEVPNNVVFDLSSTFTLSAATKSKFSPDSQWRFVMLFADRLFNLLRSCCLIKSGSVIKY